MFFFRVIGRALKIWLILFWMFWAWIYSKTGLRRAVWAVFHRGASYEPLENERIVRLAFGPRRYLRKESLWPYLDLFADRILAHFRRTRAVPDVLHSHYADAGRVGATVESLLGAPLVHTGHSLGRTKKARLLERIADLVRNAINDVSQTSKAAETQMAAQVAGKAELIDVVTAISAAEASLETVMAVRDQVIAAYQEIMRMPI